MILFAKAGKEASMFAISRREFLKNAATQAAAPAYLARAHWSFAAIRWACPLDVKRGQ